MHPRPLFLVTVLMMGIASRASSAIELPAIFADDMVLQRGRPVVVWGKADPGETVSVTLGEHAAQAKADSAGCWRATLPPPTEGRVLELSAAGKRDRVVVRNVVAGEVWLCGGQSNMEWPVSASADAAATLAQAEAEGPRLFRVAKRRAAGPVDDVGGLWLRSSAENARYFSAVGYHLGRALQARLGVPVGIIDATVGGTGIDSWLPPKTSADVAEFARAEAAYLEQWRAWQARTGRADPGETAAYADWRTMDYDATTWPQVALPDFRPGASVRLYRREVWLDAVPAGAARLSLGIIDDFDETWINGVRIGATDATQWQFYTAMRHYRVPPGLLRAGKNVIAIRLHDHGGGGGLTGPADAARLVLTEQSVALGGEGWRGVVEHALTPTNAGGAPGMGRAIPPGGLFNAMIVPLAPYALAGVAWYQGESDASRAEGYAEDLAKLARDWRAAWSRPELPWLVVELPNYGQPAHQPVEERGWAAFRAAQAAGVARTKNAALVPIIDLGEANDIHPRAKRPVGERLAKTALALVYAQADGALPPKPRETQWREDGEVRVVFSEVGAGLRSSRAEALPGFALRGEDGVWHTAEARLETDGASVLVRAKAMPTPKELRYAWAGNPETDLHAATGHVVGPFALRLEDAAN